LRSLVRHEIAREKFLAKYTKEVGQKSGIPKTKVTPSIGQFNSNFRTPLSQITNSSKNILSPSPSKNTTVAPDTDEQISLELKHYRKSLFQDIPSSPIIFSTPWRRPL